MHPLSPSLAALMADVSLAARHSGRPPIDPAELEHYTHHAMGELVRIRPRITDYLPELALNRVLALLDVRARLRQTGPANRSLADQA